MKRFAVLCGFALAIGLGGAGCAKTAEGVKEDAANTGQAVSQAADTTAEATKEASKDMSAALTLTPKIKTAINADAQLNNVRNMIDVDSMDNVVHLKGHVISQAMKSRAEEVARKVIKESNATDTLKNELTVQP